MGLGAGATIAVLWLAVLATGNYAKVAAGRRDFGWHVAAELVTAVLLLIGGAGLFARTPWGPLAFAIALGALVYAITESAGHYLQSGNRLLAFAVLSGWPFAIAAAVILVTR
jgi:hypothetical protein